MDTENFIQSILVSALQANMTLFSRELIVSRWMYLLICFLEALVAVLMHLCNAVNPEFNLKLAR